MSAGRPDTAPERSPARGSAVPRPTVPAVQVWARDGRRTELAPGALDALRLLGVGRSIVLIRSDGRRQDWTVSSVAVATTPAASDAIEIDDEAGLVTLTVCGGPYLPERGGYERPLLLHCVPAILSDAA